MAPRNRFLFIGAALVVCVLGGMLLQGCGGPTATPAPGEPVEPQVVKERPDWCSGENDYRKDLTEFAAVYAPGITVDACFSDGKDLYEIEALHFDPDDKAAVLEKASPFPVKRLLAYIKVKYKGVYVSEFETPLELRITYSADALEAIKKDGYTYPRIAYLVPAGKGWVDSWVEFSPEYIQVAEPDSGTPEKAGILYLILPELPDPLIGGC